MYFAKHFLTGLLAVHLMWAFFFAAGLVIRREKGEGDEDAENFYLADLVIASVAGMALAGFCLLFLGFTGLLKPAPILATILAAGCVFSFTGPGNVFSWRFWRRAARLFFGAWNLPAICLWVLFVFLAMPAILPATESDPVRYHLPYALEWANAGRIYVDPFLRFPYYANNFLLLYAALFVFKLGTYCQLLGWLCGLLTCMGIQAFISSARACDLHEESPNAWFGHPEQYLVPLCLAVCPIFLRYLDTAYIDIPIGLFILTPILCAYRSFNGHRGAASELVLIAAFCVGAKTTLFVCLPLFLISCILATRNEPPFRKTVGLCLVLCAFSLPWYVRNLIECGDPIPPLFSVCFNRPDVIFNKADVFVLTHEPATSKDPVYLAFFPFFMVGDPESRNFREWGINGVMLFMYAPVLLLPCCLWLRKRWRPAAGLAYLAAAAVYLQIFWLLASTLGRYALHWLPVYVSCIGVALFSMRNYLAARWKSVFARRIVGSCACAIATFLCCPLRLRGGERLQKFYADFWKQTIPAVTTYVDDQRYLIGSIPCYGPTYALIETFKANNKPDRRVLDIGVSTEFYMIKDDVQVVGDWFGPARYDDLLKEVRHGNCSEYLGRFNIGAVIIRPDILSSESDRKFRGQLMQNRFIEYRFYQDPTEIYIRAELKPVSTLKLKAPAGA